MRLSRRVALFRFDPDGAACRMRLIKTLVCCLGLLSVCSCTSLDLLRFQNAEKDKDDDENRDRRKDTDFVGNFAAINGNNVITIHGVGLVTGLENTGED